MTERELEVWLSDWFRGQGAEVVEDVVTLDGPSEVCEECDGIIRGSGSDIVLRRLAVDLIDCLGLPT